MEYLIEPFDSKWFQRDFYNKDQINFLMNQQSRIYSDEKELKGEIK